MKLNYKEDPKEWRKSAVMSVIALTIIISLLRWRQRLPVNTWYFVLALLAIVAISSVLRPRWFRGYYRLSMMLGFYSSRFVGRCVLGVLFFLIVTPLGLVFRLAGKDPLQLKRPQDAATYWHQAKDCGPLDRLF
jgi:hypothetical protein